MLAAQHVQHHIPLVWAFAMLEQVDSLPCAERQPAMVYRDAELRLRQRGANVRSHVVGPFGGMPVEARIIGYQPLEEIGQIDNYVRIGVFLDHQRRRGVLAKNGQEPGLDMLVC